jgi:hypothetical protein
MASQNSSTMLRPLSVETGDADDNNISEHQQQQQQQFPLDVRILEIIESIPDRTIRPARLAAELGISVEDASAELCGLLAAVGGGSEGASFRFDKNDERGTLTMVFTFPIDFRTRAMNQRRREDSWQAILSILRIVVKALKIITAAGLILSLFIVSVAVMAGLIAALIALSRGGGDRRQHSLLTSQIHHVFFTIRQLLWCYALFGPTGTSDDETSTAGGTGGQDPFLREVAYDLWLLLSVCCGNPGSLFYWIHASHLNRRRSRAFRGWGQRNRNLHNPEIIPGVTIVDRHRTDDNNNQLSDGTSEYRGILSVAVEFLFGPSPFVATPSTEDIWKLRAAFIIQESAKNPHGGVSIEALAPFVDSPPENVDDSTIIMSQALLIVSFFNGVPVKDEQECNPDDMTTELRQSKFVFPELMAESTVVPFYDHRTDADDGTLSSILFTTAERYNTSSRRQAALPSYLIEENYKFSKLTRQQFLHCILLGSLNLIGVFWFGQSISAGGVLNVSGSPLEMPLRKVLYPVLRFYALLFFSIPAGRLIFILVLNSMRKQRNVRRARCVQRSLRE